MHPFGCADDAIHEIANIIGHIASAQATIAETVNEQSVMVGEINGSAGTASRLTQDIALRADELIGTAVGAADPPDAAAADALVPVTG
jgi:methyl-accepting chemotaxis protein